MAVYNHIAIDCGAGYGGKVDCIRLDDFNNGDGVVGSL